MNKTRLAAAVLRVQPDAPAHHVRRAYLARVAETHPDRPGGSHGAFLAVQTAWEVVQVLATTDADVVTLPTGEAGASGPWASTPTTVGRVVDVAA